MRAALKVGTAALSLTCLAMSGRVLATQTEADVNAIHDALAAPLAGTLLKASEEKAPAVLIIPGSGPTDRNGNNPIGIKAASYRMLAEGLATAGISSLRIDKRGMFASKDAVPNPNDVTIPDYVADTRAWAELLAQETSNDCIWLLGHSEGAVIALATVMESTEGICGIALVASPGRPIGHALREQLEANPANAPILEMANAAISKLEAGEDVAQSEIHPALMPLFGPHIQGFLKSLFSYDPTAMLAAYDGPALVLHGEEDIQIGVAEIEALERARDDTKIVRIAGMNHVLKTVPAGDRAANQASYADAMLPLAEGVVDAIAEFVRGRGQSSQLD